MTKEQCIGLLKRYAEYDGMGIPNLAGCKDAMRMAEELLEGLSLPSNLDEAALKELQTYLPQGNGPDGICYFIAPQMLAMYKAGAEWMAGQGETIEGYIAGTNEVAAILAIPRKEYNKGDKVVVQIRKK